MSETNTGSARSNDSPPNAANVTGVSVPVDCARRRKAARSFGPREAAAGADPLPVADSQAGGEAIDDIEAALKGNRMRKRARTLYRVFRWAGLVRAAREQATQRLQS